MPELETYFAELIDEMSATNYENVYNRLCGAYTVAVIIKHGEDVKRFFEVGKEKYNILKRRQNKNA